MAPTLNVSLIRQLSHPLVAHLPHNQALRRHLSLYLASSCTLQQFLQHSLLGLQIRVPSDVLFPDENVRHAPLIRDLHKRILDIGTVVNLIELDDEGLGAELRKERLGCVAVGAVGLGENDWRRIVN